MDGIKEEEEDEDEFVEDDELPEWAKRTTFEGDTLGRAHALLAYFLPSTLLPHLGPPNNRAALLTSLSSGQLLCAAYNAAVRKSKKPWGFVSKDGIHDIIALEKAALASGAAGEEDVASGASGKKVWTFRRTDNLRLWAGALKIRYTLPIETPSHLLATQPTPGSAFNTPLSSPSGAKTRFAFGPRGKDDREPPILFDPPVVAKREAGWDDMLEAVLTRWVDKAVEERRSVQS
ncbi:hypothetical protein NLJ89_g1486 [Agrocybe chaxingu]|uniref:Uncharacterized protein n=1 Tax=Agrocybe chaxingu TaxID=84603 RepID=A0A9W8MZX8_9AGAR|nr:hypothetical protein NLJ89_g1486 [Agrocybe chaxingu]